MQVTRQVSKGLAQQINRSAAPRVNLAMLLVSRANRITASKLIQQTLAAPMCSRLQVICEHETMVIQVASLSACFSYFVPQSLIAFIALQAAAAMFPLPIEFVGTCNSVEHRAPECRQVFSMV